MFVYAYLGTCTLVFSKLRAEGLKYLNFVNNNFIPIHAPKLSGVKITTVAVNSVTTTLPRV